MPRCADQRATMPLDVTTLLMMPPFRYAYGVTPLMLRHFADAASALMLRLFHTLR